jgi:predicted RND superfamily exporter protein
LIQKRRGVLSVAAVLTALGTFFSVRLYSDLRSNIEELLPDSSLSVRAARDIAPKLHSVTHLSIVLENGDPKAMQRFADALAARLRALPKEEVAAVEYRIDEQRAFFERFGALYLDRSDLQSIVSQIEERVAWEKRQAVPALSLLDEEDDPKPELDFQAIEEKYTKAAGAAAQFKDGYFMTPEGNILVLLVRPPDQATGYHFNKKLLDAVKQEVHSLDPKSYDPKMVIGYDGEVASLLEEQQALVSDLATSSAVVLVLVVVVLWFYFRRWSAIGSVLLALLVPIAVTFGLGEFLVGHLNGNSAFLGSIVVGNGINVSLIYVARYLEERRKGVQADEAIRIAWATTLVATFVASFSAALAYFALAVTDFRGFNQFGILGGIGMSLCWVAAYLLLPPILKTVDAHRPVELLQASAQVHTMSRIASWTMRHVVLLRALSLLLLGGAVVGVLSYRGPIVEYDYTRVRAKKSQESGSLFWGRKVDQVFKAYLTPIVVRANTPADLHRIVDELNRERKELGDTDPIREIRTIETLLPSDQAEKIPLIQRLQELLPESRIRKLDPDARSKAEQFLPKGEIRAVTLNDIPENIRLPMVERDGSVGRVALVFPKVVGILQPSELERLTDLIRGSIAKAGGQGQAVGQALLFNDISHAIMRDGPIATVIAFAFVCLLVIFAFRHVRPVLTVLGGLLLGVAWLVGYAALARERMNFLNFVVLPITFGIGVDYAVNIVQRFRLEGEQSFERALRETGGAVALCSATTIIGYASLLVAENRALSGFGFLASVGELSCLMAALFAIPAWVTKAPARQRRTEPRDSSGAPSTRRAVHQ